MKSFEGETPRCSLSIFTRRLSGALFAVLLAGLTLQVSAGVVSTPDQAGLLAGLAGGGNVTFACDGTIVLTQTVVIAQSTVLDASGHSITISGSNAVRVFYVDPGVSFTVANLTVANGNVTGTNGTANGASGQPAFGGAIYNSSGTVVAVNCLFSSNSVVGGDGGLGYGTPGGNGGAALGGAIFNDAGVLNVTNCVFSRNTAAAGGGGDADGSPAGNGGPAYGGAIQNNSGTLNLTGTTFVANQALGGIFIFANEEVNGNTGSSAGGAVSTLGGTVMVLNCAFAANSASQVVTTNFWYTYGYGGNASGGGLYQAAGILYLNSTTFSNNNVFPGSTYYYEDYTAGNGSGGALFVSATLFSTNCSFAGNVATGGAYDYHAGNGDGGGICNLGSATLVNATVAGNAAAGGQPGEYFGFGNYTFPGVARGGGIFNSNVLVLLDSTISGNVAVGCSNLFPYTNLPSEPGGDAFGGGIYNLGSCHATNDTVFANAAAGGSPNSLPAGNGSGGGLYNSNANAVLAYVTLCSNSAAGGSGSPSGSGFGGGINANSGLVTLLDSIVAFSPSGTNLLVNSNALLDAGHNVSSDSSFTLTGTGSLNNTDPKLGALGNYGGPTLTVPLLVGSPAIDAGDSVSCPATDQRGLARPYGPACDIGAFEYYPSFTVQGQIHGWQAAGAVVSAGIFSGTPDASGNYTILGVIAGSYAVTPAGASAFYSPASTNVTVGPNAIKVNFTGYGLNALNVQSYTHGILQVAFGGAVGQTFVVDSSTDLSHWTPYSTNQVGTNNLGEVSITTDRTRPTVFFRAHSP